MVILPKSFYHSYCIDHVSYLVGFDYNSKIQNTELAPNSPLVVVEGWTFIDRDEDGLILSGKLQHIVTAEYIYFRGIFTNELRKVIC